MLNQAQSNKQWTEQELHAYLANQTGAHMEALKPLLRVQLYEVSKLIHTWMDHQGFWKSENVGEKLMLITSEIAEAMEADRKDVQKSEHIPNFSGVEEELADAVIRILDFAYHYNLRLADAIVAKTHYNLTRQYQHGKKY